MKTYQCDRCGKTHTLSEIVGTEFDYHGFKTLTKSFAPIHDVCGGCYNDIMNAMKSARDESIGKDFLAAKKVAFANAVPKKRGLFGWFR